MKLTKSIGLLTLILAASCHSGDSANQTSTPMATPPKAKKIPHEITTHGDTRLDNYYWMRLTDEQKNAPDSTRDQQTKDVLEYLNAENDYTKAMMAHTDALKEKIFQEMKGRIKETDQSVPIKDHGYWYYTRFEAGQDYSINCRKKDSMENGQEQVLINGPEMAKGHDYWALASIDISEDNKWMCYGTDVVSRRIYTIQIKNLETGEILNDKLEGTSGSATWAADNKTIFYAKKDPQTLRESQIWRHTLGTDQAKDELVFEEKDEEFSCFVYKTKSDKFLVIGSSQTVSSEYRVLEANNPTGNFRIIQPRERNLEYGIDHYGDKFYIVTNLDAKNFRLMETPINATTKDHWKEVIPHRADVLLEGITIFKDYLVIDERKNGLTQIRIKAWNGSEDYYMEFQDPTYAASVGANPDFDTHLLRYGYSSLTTPSSTYEYDLDSKKRNLLKQQEVVGGYDANNYQSERLYATAADGTKVPISLVYKKGYNKDGKAPLLLYAYGSYGYSIDATFSSSRLSLLDRGFVFAIAHIRGGQEMGRQWYEDGKLLNKKNTFNDFIDCGKYLINEKYTSKEKLFAMGGSAGGLLMGAITNMAPDMWKGIISAAPFVDVVTTMLDESIPLTTFEFDEWGNPKNKEYYDYMKSYSPYDNIEAKNYPNILVTSGYWDSQVQYWGPAKYVAKMREMKTDNNMLLFWCNMDAGHGGKSGRFEYLKEVAMEYVFMLDLAGIKE